MKTNILLLALLISQSITAQIVNIPDAIFKAALLAPWNNINTNGDGEIQVSEASAFAGTIDVDAFGISDLTGIEAFTALTELHCSWNSLTSLDVSNNITLEYLLCTYNSLTSLDVNNPKLVTLNCNSNSLTSLDVSANTLLENLLISNNFISSIDVSNNLELKVLGCGHNLLTELEISLNTNIEQLQFENNFLSKIDVSSNSLIDIFQCDSNKLTDLNVLNNQLLVQLDCDNNLITYLDLRSNTALKMLKCHNNLLNGLDVRNGNNTNMFVFNATNNANLNCISVDDTVYSNTNWSSKKDSWADYSNDCTVGIEDNELNQISITGHGNTITIKKAKGTVTIFNTIGKRVFTTKLHSGINNISLKKGIYLVRIVSNDKQVTRKVYLSGN